LIQSKELPLLTRFFFSFFVAFSLFLTACSNDDGGAVNQIVFDNIDDANAAILNMSITCEGECPESVGGLVNFSSRTTYSMWGTQQTEYLLSVCSLTLIGPDRVLTNRHCVPDNSKFVGGSCKDMTIYFPAINGQRFIRTGCASVENLSQNYGDRVANPDWAILKLTRSITERQAAVVNAKDGIPHESTMIYYPVNFYSTDINARAGQGSVYGLIKKTNCTTSMSNRYAIFYNSPYSPLYISTCDQNMISGNSGSGSFNGQGELAGVFSFGRVDEAVDAQFLGRTTFINKKWGGGTNLSCLTAFSNNINDEMCRFSDTVEAINEGRFRSRLLGQFIPEPAYNQTLDQLNEDDEVRWEENSDSVVSFFSPKYLNQISTQTSEAVDDYVNTLISQRSFPFLPTCIEASQKSDDSYTLRIPYFRLKSLSDARLLQNGDYEIPLEKASVIFSMSYDDDEDVFKGELSPLSRSGAHIWNTLQETSLSSQLSCFARESCRIFRDFYRELDDFLVDVQNPDGEGLLWNQYILDQHASEDMTLTLPVCESVASNP
jgi:hypothetical protein